MTTESTTSETNTENTLEISKTDNKCATLEPTQNGSKPPFGGISMKPDLKTNPSIHQIHEEHELPYIHKITKENDKAGYGQHASLNSI